MEALRRELSRYEQVPEDYLVCGNGAAEVIFMLAHGPAAPAGPASGPYLRGSMSSPPSDRDRNFLFSN